jgi:hypothetical protein
MLHPRESISAMIQLESSRILFDVSDIVVIIILKSEEISSKMVKRA